MHNKFPLISILIPYYNDAKYLRKSIESVLNQTYQNFELILLNHATTDNCRDIAHSYNDKRIKHIDMPYNLGFGGSGILLKEFLKYANGKYVKFFCADDVMYRTGIEDLVNYMETNPCIDFAFGDCEYINENNKDLKTSFFKNRKFFSINNTEIDCIRLYSKGESFLPWIGSIVKTEILNNMEINTTFIMMFDMSVWLSLLCKGYKIGYIDKIVAKYRIHSGQLSSMENQKIAIHNSYFESLAFFKIFLTINDIELVKKIWNNSTLVENLNDINDIPFVISRELLETFPAAYSYITDLLNNDNKRFYLENKYGYGIRELRQDIHNAYKLKNDIKNNIYNKNNKDLNIFELTFLIFRQIFNILTLKFVKKWSKKKKYSL